MHNYTKLTPQPNPNHIVGTCCWVIFIIRRFWKSVVYFFSVIQGQIHLKAVCLDSCQQSLRLQVWLIISHFLISVRFDLISGSYFRRPVNLPAAASGNSRLSVCHKNLLEIVQLFSQPQTVWFWHVRGKQWECLKYTLYW